MDKPDFRWAIADPEFGTRLSVICDTQHEAETKLKKRMDLIWNASGEVIPVLVIPVAPVDVDSEKPMTVRDLILHLATLDMDSPVSVYTGDDFGQTESLCPCAVHSFSDNVRLG